MKFTKSQLDKWSKYNLKPVYFPSLTIGENYEEKGYTKPEQWFYDKINEGKVAKDADTLKEGWYLVDFTESVDHTDGSQVFKKDPLAPLITKLRKEGKIGKYDNTPLGSRFSITHDEWKNEVLPMLSKELGVEFRLERAIEFNYIGNKFDKNRGKFNVWEWFEDLFGDSGRLCGGRRDCGGLASVGSSWRDGRYGSMAARPLGVLELGTLDPLDSSVLSSDLENRVKTLEEEMAKIRKLINF